MRIGFKSDKGMIREKNEDYLSVLSGNPGIPLAFIIADGMGGHNSGEVASKSAVDFISSYILQFPETMQDEHEILSVIRDVVMKANASVYNLARTNEEHLGMGTTLIAAVELKHRLYIAHVGDSRAYVLRDGQMTRITKDHSYIEELISQGSLTREEAENHPKRNIITRALGCEESILVDTYESEILKNDIYLLCTDGLTTMLKEDEIRSVLESEPDPQQACNILVDRANGCGGEDNISVIVFKNEE